MSHYLTKRRIQQFLFRCLGSAVQCRACIEEVLSESCRWIVDSHNLPAEYVVVFLHPSPSALRTQYWLESLPGHFATAEDFRIFLPKYLDRTFKQTMASSYPKILEFSSFGATEILQLTQCSEISCGPVEIITPFLLFSSINTSSSY